ncbi:hypothetical protein [Gaetbulibacter sp. PBL-D1]|uniref:hypothetical protein n=1 Tax=Gaetbulibacter sp. PBL-D1 TaxID=3422594 RepID=UPI003D2F3461
MKYCYENLVGLSRTECDCYEVDEALTKSTQGLWLDELEGIDMEVIKNALKCGEELSDNFEKIYNNAINFLESELQVEISNHYQQKHKAYVGRIGERKFSQTLATSTYSGLKLDTKHIEGASIIVKKVMLYFANTGTLTLEVYKNGEKLDDDYEITIDAVGGVVHELESPLILPIVENGEKNEYMFVYETGSLQPYNTKTSCGCSGVESVRKKYITPVGVKGATIEGLDNVSNYSFGLSLDVVISCSIDSLICDFLVDSVFERRFAMALWYKMGVLTIEDLFASRDINFDTFSDREYLYGRKRKFEKNFSSLVMWLAENSTIHNSNCFVCNTQKKVSMGGKLI